MKNVKIAVQKCSPCSDTGRCNVCCKEYATRILSIDRIQNTLFCDGCWKKFKEVISGVQD